MTEIILENTNTETSLCVMGHCNAGRINGMDLCCCAVSMLVFTMLQSLKKLKPCGFRYSYGGGWCHVNYIKTGREHSEANTVINTIMNGFDLLEKRYPNNVKVYLKEVIKNGNK